MFLISSELFSEIELKVSLYNWDFLDRSNIDSLVIVGNSTPVVRIKKQMNNTAIFFTIGLLPLIYDMDIYFYHLNVTYLIVHVVISSIIRMIRFFLFRWDKNELSING